jgi:hypothetical protein
MYYNYTSTYVTGGECFAFEANNHPDVQVFKAKPTWFVLASALITCPSGQFQHKILEQC